MIHTLNKAIGDIAMNKKTGGPSYTIKMQPIAYFSDFNCNMLVIWQAINLSNLSKQRRAHGEHENGANFFQLKSQKNDVL